MRDDALVEVPALVTLGICAWRNIFLLATAAVTMGDLRTVVAEFLADYALSRIAATISSNGSCCREGLTLPWWACAASKTR